MQIPQDPRLFLGFRCSPELGTAQSVAVDGREAMGDVEMLKNALEGGDGWRDGWRVGISAGCRRLSGSIRERFCRRRV